jgi:hypothetical protein
MTEYIATFHTHLSAMRTQRTLANLGVFSWLALVPRYLSASCGTCVLYTADQPFLEQMDADVERVVERLPQGETVVELLSRL